MTAETVERSFSFVDLAGFSALTEAHGDHDAVAVIDRFLALSRQALSEGDELVKSIGDAVMFASPGPAAAVALLDRVWQRCADQREFLLPRAGTHHGSAVGRDGDYFGAAVNLAARVAGHAGGGQVLATTAVADAARADSFKVVDLGEHRLRHLPEPVRLFEIYLEPADRGEAIDPVCRMWVDPENAAGSLVHDDRRFWFCSLGCAGAFAADPTSYLASLEQGRA